MARSTPNIVLKVWDLLSDRFSHTELASNWDNIDAHDHTTGKGLQIPTGGIANTAVTTGKLADNAVTTAKITDANVTGPKIANAAVDGSKIAGGTVDATKLASDSVTTVKILDANVTTNKIADANVTGAKVADATLTAPKFGSALSQSLGVNTSRAQISTATAQNMPVDTLGSLPTADKVTVVVPNNSMLAVQYYGRMVVGGVTSGSVGGAALYVGGVQVPGNAFNGALNSTGEAVFSASTSGTYTGSMMTATDILNPGLPLFFVGATGFAFVDAAPNVFALGEWLLLDVTTGGTLDIEVKWRRLSVRSTSGTVQDRRLRVMTWAV